MASALTGQVRPGSPHPDTVADGARQIEALKALAGALSVLAANPERVERMGRNARALAEREFGRPGSRGRAPETSASSRSRAPLGGGVETAMELKRLPPLVDDVGRWGKPPRSLPA